MSFYEIQALSAYISTVVLDDNKRHSINEVLEFLVGVGTFTNTSSLFDTQGLQFVTMNKLKKSMPGDLWLLTFDLVVSYSVYILLIFEATSHKAVFVVLYEDGANVSFLNGGVFFRRDDTQYVSL